MNNLTLICVAITLIATFKNVGSANILFVAVIPSHSHQSVFQPVWKELSKRGHKVTVITPNPLKDSTLTNLTEIDISGIYESLKQTNIQSALTKPDFATVFIKDSFVTKMFSKLNEYVFTHEGVQKLLNEEHTFDLVIVEWLFPTFGALATKYQAPLVGITSLGAPIPSLDTLGNPSHPIIAPDHNLPVSRDMTFKERLMSSLWAVYVRLYYHLAVLPREDKLVKKYLGEDMPYLGDIERNISLLLLNRNPVFHKIMPVVPAIVELGYTKSNKSSQELDKELQNFLDNSKNGAIYFSLGTNVKANYLPKETLNAILNTLKNIPYNVVFKGDNDMFDDVPKNILLRSWLPQNTLLSHPNVKLFIMQGGLQSSEEAIINKVPVIGIPFHADQTSNSDTMEKYGMGKRLEAVDITEETFTFWIKEIMTNPSYQTNVENLAKVFVDYPVDGLEKAIWWIEYVIRHKGAKHLRSSSLDIPFYQYFMLDIFSLLFVILAVLTFVSYIVIKIIYKIGKKLIGCSSCKKTQSKRSKKDQ